MELTIRGHTVLKEGLEGNQTCLDDDTLILLITLIPGLEEFYPLIKELIKKYGHIPGDVFSVCLDVYNVTYTPLGKDKERVDGCALLNSTIMCWEGKCLYKGVDHFGCFSVEVPTVLAVTQLPNRMKLNQKNHINTPFFRKGPSESGLQRLREAIETPKKE